MKICVAGQGGRSALGWSKAFYAAGAEGAKDDAAHKCLAPLRRGVPVPIIMRSDVAVPASSDRRYEAPSMAPATRRPVGGASRDSLANPEALDWFAGIATGRD